ncbi:MAG: hypothetical protein JWN30_2808 [Bacilli bacterium]|nr:hypothetical protein [Bacilli bacterium]
MLGERGINPSFSVMVLLMINTIQFGINYRVWEAIVQSVDGPGAGIHPGFFRGKSSL